MITDHICEWSLPTGETLRILANLAEASAPILYEADGSWCATPYQEEILDAIVEAAE